MPSLGDRIREALAPRYLVERKLATGGMASVYRGYDPSLDRPVAIKVLRPELATARGAERFMREARNLAHLSHPNILPIHEVGEVDGLYFYVMDYVDAPTLRELLSQGPIPESESVRVATDLLRALEAVHAAGLVHRDVKPGNVFVTPDRALLGDFGIAKEFGVERGETLTKDGHIVGTPGYMAPEQDSGGVVTPRSDLYSVALVLFQCLTGGSFSELDTLPDDVTWSRVPKRLREPMARALARDPEERWPDVAVFREALEASAVRPEGETTGPAFTRRRLAAGVPVLVAVAAVGGLVIRGCADSGPLDSFAWLPCDDLSPEGDQAHFADNLAEEMTNRLSTIPGLTGVEHPTASAVKQLELSPEDIGRLLNVDAVIECSVLREGDSIEVGVTLSEARGGDMLLEREYTGAWPAVFEIQDEIRRDIVWDLLGTEAALPPDGATPSLGAYQLYLLGRQSWWERTGPALSQAEEWFRRAIEADPTYARAHAGLADIYVVLTARGLRGLSPDSAFHLARRHAEEAIRLDGRLAEPFAALAEAKRAYFWEDWSEAEEDYLRAIGRNPSYAQAHSWYSLYLSAMGRHDSAVAEAREAVRLDFLSSNMARQLAIAHFYQRDFERALVEATRAVELDPTFPEALFWQIGVLLVTGQRDEALALLRAAEAQAAASPPAPLYHAVLAYGFAAAGDHEHARTIMQHLPVSPEAIETYVSPFWMAVANAHLGETDLAFEWLAAAYDLRDEFMVHLKVSPFVDPLRGDPRFAALEDRMSAFIDR